VDFKRPGTEFSIYEATTNTSSASKILQKHMYVSFMSRLDINSVEA